MTHSFAQALNESIWCGAPGTYGMKCTSIAGFSMGDVYTPCCMDRQEQGCKDCFQQITSTRENGYGR